MRAVCAIRAARLDRCVGAALRFVVVRRFGVVRPLAPGAAELDCAVPDAEEFAAGAAGDCAEPACPIPAHSSTSNPNKTVKLTRSRRKRDHEGEKPNMIQLYDDFPSSGIAGEPLA